MNWHRILLCTLFPCFVLTAPPASAAGLNDSSVSIMAPAELRVLGREIVIFRSAVGPYSPEQRVTAASAMIQKVLESGNGTNVATTIDGETIRVMAHGQVVFSVTPGDALAVAGETPQAIAANAADRLKRVLAESRELRDKRRLAVTLIKLAGVTAAWLGLIWVLARNRRWVDSRLLRLTAQKAEEIKSHTLRTVGLQNIAPLLRGATAALFWLFFGVTSFLWTEYVLQLFPHTRAFGEQLSGRFLVILGGFGQGTLHALPGLGVVLIVWLGARFAVTACKRYFNGVIQGRFKSNHFDETSAAVTLRLSVLMIWVAAIIVAFPYIPGSKSPAFQGIGVLSGLMLSLGASSVIGQWVNGLILVYNRTCQIGDYVKVGEFEGTLVNIGFSTSRLLTSRNEEVILPNSQLTSGSLINYTRQNEQAGVIVPVSVTIGYDSPWRQVHAMLVEAARRTAGLKSQPQPAVFQTQLSDFYVEYQLRVALEEPARRNAITSELNANIQDVFNEFGVQIMSPHFLENPAQPVVVPREKWHSPPADKPNP